MRKTCAFWSAGPALALLVTACGGGSDATGPTPVPTPSPSPTPADVLLAQGGGQVEAEFLVRVQFTTTQAGTIEATLDWTYAENDLDLALVRGDCSFEQFIDEQCQILAFSESETAKPEKVRVPGEAAGPHTMFFYNYGPGDESVSYRIVLSPGAVAAAAARSARIDAARLERMRRARGFVSF